MRTYVVLIAFAIGTLPPPLQGQEAERRGSWNARGLLALDGALRGAIIGRAALYVADGGNTTADAYRAAEIGGALAGVAAGVLGGRTLTDDEAHAAIVGSNITGMAAAGAIGTVGGFGAAQRRAAVAAIVAACWPDIRSGFTMSAGHRTP